MFTFHRQTFVFLQPIPNNINYFPLSVATSKPYTQQHMFFACAPFTGVTCKQMYTIETRFVSNEGSALSGKKCWYSLVHRLAFANHCHSLIFSHCINKYVEILLVHDRFITGHRGQSGTNTR